MNRKPYPEPWESFVKWAGSVEGAAFILRCHRSVLHRRANGLSTPPRMTQSAINAIFEAASLDQPYK